MHVAHSYDIDNDYGMHCLWKLHRNTSFEALLIYYDFRPDSIMISSGNKYPFIACHKRKGGKKIDRIVSRKIQNFVLVKVHCSSVSIELM